MYRDNRLFRNIVLTLLFLVGMYDFLALGGVFEYLSLYISIISHRGVNLAFLIALAYLIMPAKKGQTKICWYDVCLLLLGFIPAIYVTIFPNRIFQVTENPDLVTVTEMILFLGLILSILEAGRRGGGLGLLIVSAFFFSVVFLGDYYPGPFYSRTLSLQSVTAYMYLCLGASSLFGMVTGLGSTILIAFMLFGGFLQISGAGEFFIKLGLAVAGKYRGGPAKVAILASALMGSISGSGVANVVTTGTFTIPLMKKVGFRPHFAGAVEAVASNGGQIAPPVMGAVAFLMAQMLNITYWDVCIAAFIPAALYYVALFFMIDFEAAKQELKGLPKRELPSLKLTVKGGWYYFLPIVLLIFLIAKRTFSVERSCIFSIMLLVVLSFLGGREKRFTIRKFVGGIQAGVRGMVLIAGPLFSAGIIIGSIQMSGIGINFTRLITQFAGESVFLMLILAALSSLILGMGMSSVPCYVICALLVGPPMIAAGIAPIAAHLFFFYWGILSFITPPVAVSALAASGIAGASFWRTGFTAMRLGILSYIVPFFFIYQPALLLKGGFVEIVVSIITAIFGCFVLSTGIIGYFLKKMNFWMRLLSIGGGLLMIYPGWVSDVIGLTVFSMLILSQLRQVRLERDNLKRMRTVDLSET
jgi:TRAP transporter 4TM/12TM fusion protein